MRAGVKGVCKELLLEPTTQLKVGELDITSSIISVGEAAFVLPFNLTGGREFMSKNRCESKLHFHLHQEYFMSVEFSLSNHFLLTKFAK